jgi:hypothetical protein
MCCFSRSVRHVSSTRIFARPLPEGRQLVVYGMSLELDEDVAMVLPIPVPAGSPEDAVRFVDLSGHARFLDEIDALFPAEITRGRESMLAAPQAPRQKIAVHDVGDFEASFVPSQADFDRLDERFRLPAGVWGKLPGYADWGFCVFKLRPPSGILAAVKSIFSKLRTIHPMAFDFPRRDPRAIFFPTVHVHDGAVHEKAEFDHALFVQPDAAWEPLIDWQRSEARPPSISAGGTELACAGAFVYRKRMNGDWPNRDTIIDEGKLLRRHAFGPTFRLRMKTDAQETGWFPTQWREVTEAELERIKLSVFAELVPSFEKNQSAWRLRPFRNDLPLAYPEFYESFPTALPPDVRDGCLVSFRSSLNDGIEPQELTVAFAGLPSKDEREAIHVAFAAAIKRATA